MRADERTIGGINRRLVALRSLLRVAHRLGLSETEGHGLVANIPAHQYSTGSGLSASQLRSLLVLPNTNSATGLRDVALLRLLVENALSGQQVRVMNVRDLNLDSRTLNLPNNQHGVYTVTLSAVCIDALRSYLRLLDPRKASDEPLFTNLDHRPSRRGCRLTANGLRHIVGAYGRRIGLDITPQSLRQNALRLALGPASEGTKGVRALSKQGTNLPPLRHLKQGRRKHLSAPEPSYED